MMRRIVLAGPGRLVVDEHAGPAAGEGEALVRIRKVGICGSDMQLFRHGAIGSIRAVAPFVIGHECMGDVVDVAAGMDTALVGRRVAIEPAVHCGGCRFCRDGRFNICTRGEFLGLPPRPGALQEQLSHPVSLLLPLPDGVSDESGVMLEPLAIALHAIDLVQPRSGQSVAILGTGVLGTCVLELLRHHGHAPICIDRLEPRLARAARLGAAATVDASAGPSRQIVQRVRELTDGDGADIVFECAGSDETLEEMCELAAPGGVIAVIGSNPDDRVSFVASSARRKGLRIQFVRRSLNTLERCLQHVVEHGDEVDGLVTHCYAAGEAQQAFETVADYCDGVLKALVDMTQW
jgi:L-iditol 2-dehydrogenase